MLKMANENRESVLLERAMHYHRMNSFMLCLMGIYVKAREQSLVPKSPLVFLEPAVRRKIPHFICFSLFVNAMLFQSYSLYGVVINRDLSRVGAIDEL